MIRQIKFVRLHGFAMPPYQAWMTDAGSDLVVAEECRLSPGQSADVRSGIAIALPNDCWGFIVGRSSAIRKRGIEVVPAIIDPGFRGELFTWCRNLSGQPVTLSVGERVGQIIVVPKAERIEWLETIKLEPGCRGEAGFGSTGGHGS